VENAVWKTAASHWGAVTRGAGLALTVVAKVPAAAVRPPNQLARALLGADRVPLHSPELPGGGPGRARPAAGRSAGGGVLSGVRPRGNCFSRCDYAFPFVRFHHEHRVSRRIRSISVSLNVNGFLEFKSFSPYKCPASTKCIPSVTSRIPDTCLL
jgi:hypothetical protein